MINREYFYQISCDVCNEENEDRDGLSWWSDEMTANEKASDNEWHLEENVAICEKCCARIEKYIKECGYTWTIDEIIIMYEKHKKGFYTSFTANEIIQKFFIKGITGQVRI